LAKHFPSKGNQVVLEMYIYPLQMMVAWTPKLLLSINIPILTTPNSSCNYQPQLIAPPKVFRREAVGNSLAKGKTASGTYKPRRSYVKALGFDIRINSVVR
jgi:hypothetical protein